MARRGLWAVGLLWASGCYQSSFPEGPGSGCEGASAALADELYGIPQGCTVILDLNGDFGVQQWAVVCGAEPDTPIEESQARRLTECCEEDGVAVNPPQPKDAFVFSQIDDEGNGTVAVVSRHTATRVYEASLQAGESSIVYPRQDAWREPSTLATDCTPDDIVEVSSYDESGDAPPVAVLEVLNRTKTTGVVDAMRSGDGELLWTVVLRAGAGEPGSGGWVALLQSSSLGIDFSAG